MSTSIKNVVASPRAAAVLESAGYNELADLDGIPMERIAELKGVGQATINALEKAANFAPTPQESEPEWEEGPHPIHLDSPRDSLAIRITHASTAHEGQRVRVINPIFLRFSGGEASLTRELFMLGKYRGDKIRAKKALNDKEPWRVEAVEWLKGKPSYKCGDFIILTD